MNHRKDSVRIKKKDSVSSSHQQTSQSVFFSVLLNYLQALFLADGSNTERVRYISNRQIE